MIFITLEEVLELHQEVIALDGGAQGVRDIGLLTSAVEMPRAMFGGIYLHPTIFEQAAAYLFHIIGNHAFVDGNKRTGVLVTLAFLSLNGIELVENSHTLERFVIEVAQRGHAKREIAIFLETLVVPD